MRGFKGEYSVKLSDLPIYYCGDITVDVYTVYDVGG